MRYSIPVIVLLAAAPALAGNEVGFIMTIDGSQETPAVVTAAGGSGVATLNTATNELSWDITYAGLTGPATAAHFHGPAGICVNAGVEVSILAGGGPPDGQIIGSAVISAGQAVALLAGLWYVNIHTAQHPGGEIRGQVAPPPLADPVPPVGPGTVHVKLETVATGLTAPNWGTHAPGDTRLFVTDQDGILWAIDLDSGDKTVFLDVSPLLVDLGIFGPDSFDERGLLGVAFHPDYPSNGLVYTYTSEHVFKGADFTTMPPGALPNHRAVIREWQVPDPQDTGSVVDPTTSRTLLRVDEPQFNHDGGAVSFGPDGMLYVSLGDGGAADDQETGIDPFGVPNIGHGCAGNGRDPSNILGTIIRIDPQGNNSANGLYGVPVDNPFVGLDGFVDEIFAYGFRNPFRFSFDSLTGDLYVGDVGQNDVEEVDIVVAGGNYGWSHKEGSFHFIPNGASFGYVTDRPQDAPEDLIDPVAEYDHADGIAIIGGFVYRGIKIPALEGSYVFGDFAQTFSNDGRLFHLDEIGEIAELQLLGQAGLGLSLLGMGQDASGELYVLGNTTGVPFGDTGVVLRIAPKVGDLDGDGITGIGDFLILLAQFGQSGVAADLDMNGTVDIIDFLILLANWG
ncbi:MAG: PQQ-dependent sugar dehydrogenase [Planctomycetota bacterium]